MRLASSRKLAISSQAIGSSTRPESISTKASETGAVQSKYLRRPRGWGASRWVLHVWVHRSCTAFVYDELLDPGSEQKVLQHSRSVRMRRFGENRARRCHERSALLGVDDFDGALGIDFDKHVVF